jgi:hypothetical protein
MECGCSILVVPDLCENEFQKELRSPSGKYVATVFHRECGATSGFNTQLAIRRSWRGFSADSGKVLAIGGRYPLDVKWADERHLLVSLPADKIYVQEDAWNDVKVEYKSAVAGR